MTVKKILKNKGNPNLKAGPGRPKGLPNKTTRILKEAILNAAEQAGGKGGMEAYLLCQAKKRNPGQFMALLGKALPMQITGEDGGPVQVKNLSDAELLALIEKAKHG